MSDFLSTMRAEQMLVDAARALGEAKAREMELEDERALAKHEAIKRIVGTPNDLTGKPHSASSAADIVASDEGYAAHLTLQREAVIATQVAYGKWEIARLHARLAGGIE